jgi:hypothetical protein
MPALALLNHPDGPMTFERASDACVAPCRAVDGGWTAN